MNRFTFEPRKQEILTKAAPGKLRIELVSTASVTRALFHVLIVVAFSLATGFLPANKLFVIAGWLRAGSGVKFAAQGRDFGKLGAMFLATLKECAVGNAFVGGLFTICGDHGIHPHTKALAGGGGAEVSNDGWLAGVHPENLLPFLGFQINERDVAAGKNLPGPLDGTGETVAGAGGL
jgi:hypothetical protein